MGLIALKDLASQWGLSVATVRAYCLDVRAPLSTQSIRGHLCSMVEDGFVDAIRQRRLIAGSYLGRRMSKSLVVASRKAFSEAVRIRWAKEQAGAIPKRLLIGRRGHMRRRNGKEFWVSPSTTSQRAMKSDG